MNCPDCGGEMWDNRPKKASGDYKPNAPDFSCKDKDGCGKKVWLDKKGAKTKAAPAEAAEDMRTPEPKPVPAKTAAARDTELQTIFAHTLHGVLKLANAQNAAVGADGINLTGEHVASLTATLFIARSKLV